MYISGDNNCSNDLHGCKKLISVIKHQVPKDFSEMVNKALIDNNTMYLDNHYTTIITLTPINHIGNPVGIRNRL